MNERIWTYKMDLLLNYVFVTMMIISVFVALLQGSYGVVKLAYNEDDDKHYVSQSHHFAAWHAVPCLTDPALTVFIHYCLDRGALQDHQCYWFFFSFNFTFLLSSPSPKIASVGSVRGNLEMKKPPGATYGASKTLLCIFKAGPPLLCIRCDCSEVSSRERTRTKASVLT